jgi:hypothetical protein
MHQPRGTGSGYVTAGLVIFTRRALVARGLTTAAGHTRHIRTHHIHYLEYRTLNQSRHSASTTSNHCYSEWVARRTVSRIAAVTKQPWRCWR